MFKRLLLALAITLLPTFAMADEIVRYQLTQWKAKHRIFFWKVHHANAEKTWL